MTDTSAKPTVVLDWDGTVTERDTLSMVVERFGDYALWRRTGTQMGHGLTHDEAIAIPFRTIRTPLHEVVAWLLDAVRLRRGFADVVERHRPVVVSSGFHELIEPVLEREGLSVELLANRVDARPDGWRVLFRRQAACRHCGEACKRASLPPGDVVFVGDGYSDRCAAMAAKRVFARDALARDLADRGVPYEPFDDLHDVVTALASRRPEVVR